MKQEMPAMEIGEEDGIPDHRRYLCRVNTVSDSVTICFGYDKPLLVGDLVLGLEAVLLSLAYVWSTFIGYGYTIRGAIDFGDIYWDEHELIGPAFINAYRLESEVAKNSRVVISSNLNKVFANLVERHPSTLTEHLFRKFRKDIDGYIIVNPQIMAILPSERAKLADDLSTIRDSVPNPIMREKYNPLISMLAEPTAASLSPADVGKY